MNNKNIVWGLITLIGIAVIVFATVGITKKYEQDSIATLAVENTTSDEFKETYMDGCMEEGAGYTFCSCTYEKLLREYGYKEFMSEAIKFAQTEVLPKRMETVILQCLE